MEPILKDLVELAGKAKESAIEEAARRAVVGAMQEQQAAQNASV